MVTYKAYDEGRDLLYMTGATYATFGAYAAASGFSSRKSGEDTKANTLDYKTTFGVKSTSNPQKTTTVLGRYNSDTKNIIEELKTPKNTDFSGSKGGFNVLNTPDKLYKSPEQFWIEYNKPFLDAAIKRGDDILMSTPINANTLYKNAGALTGYGREYFYLKSKGYELIE